MIYSPWTKFCLKNQNDPNAKQVCFTGKDARIESGMPVVAAVLIEPEGEPKKILRVTLPLGMQLIHGTRVIIDQNQPMTAPYVICFTNGCMADYEATADMIGKMKKGQGLVVQAINSTGQPICARAAARPISPRPMTVRRPIRRCSRSSRRNCRKSCRSAPTKPARSSSSSRAAAVGCRAAGDAVGRQLRQTHRDSVSRSAIAASKVSREFVCARIGATRQCIVAARGR